MNAPRPSIKRFASAVVASELARPDGLRPGAVTSETIAKLQGSFGKLVGATGFEVLLARALVLAKRDNPMLADITPGQQGDLIGLGEEVDRATAVARTVSLLSHFMELVAVLIGEDLAIRLLRNVWPEVPEGGVQGSDGTTR